MSQRSISRRTLLSEIALGAGVLLGLDTWAMSSGKSASAASFEDEEASSGEGLPPFTYCLNMGTVLGFDLSLEEEIELAADAGYDGVEVWIRRIRKYVEDGGSLADMKKRIRDLGLTVEGAIGFAAWMVEDPDRRAEGMKHLREDMELVAAIGGTRIAAPPAGANREAIDDLEAIARRYAAILELGRSTGVLPMLEIWGPSATLSRLPEAAYVVTACDDPDASLLLDAYHLYKGGSSFDGLRQLNGSKMSLFHLNDYPVDPPRETISDAHRVFPGDGVAPLGEILRTLYQTGFRGALSLELFNRTYWNEKTPEQVAREGLEKMKASAALAMEGT
jgi:sugar phosphate isomerase/epimerase